MIETGEVAVGVMLILSRPLADEERAQLKAAVIALGESREKGLIKDLAVAKGVRAYKDFVGRVWSFVLSGHLRIEEVFRTCWC